MDIYSEEFKDLFQKMMSYDPKMRPTVEEILSHPFMQGKIPSREQVFQQF